MHHVWETAVWASFIAGLRCFSKPHLLLAHHVHEACSAGYVRIVGVIYAFAIADSSIGRCLLVYFLSFACDAVDGKAARAFNQSSRLGAVLDMATDRVATAGLLALLCKFAPGYYLLWILLIMLDVSSHWFQMYVTLAYGEGSHKVCCLLFPDCKLVIAMV